jgi:D-3-phosphoglycerate dehydrogenase
MTGPLVAVSDSVFPTLDLAKGVVSELDAELRLADEPTPDAILDVARDADGMLVTYAQITGDMIRQLNRCRVIARFGIGVDNVDIEAATQANIVVTKVPDYCIDEVSDHSLGLLLALARKIPFSNQMTHAGEWKMPAVAPLYRLKGCVLGLVGFGQIPRLLAPKAQALGLKVIAYDPYVPEESMASEAVRKVELDELLEASDLISVHAPLTPDTHHMFNREAFGQMKPSAFLVNTARGPLVDEQALVEALDEGQIAGAALDVLEQEPPPADSPLLGRTDIILTPHTGFYSIESLEDLQTKAAQEVVRVLRGERPRSPVNPEVLEAN